jgi:2-polyprenyl-6-methoxyphenol hydroxylase-like FAD-dependent oxidoreductase
VNDAAEDAPVLIAGGGLVGLSTAMFLGQHGIRSIVVERLDERARRDGAVLWREHEVAHLRQGDDGVSLTVRHVPTGFVAWSSAALTGQPRADLGAALDRVLGRET